MQITLICIGKTDDKRLKSLVELYKDRLRHYVKFMVEEIPDIKKAKNLSEDQQKKMEGKLILAKLKPTDSIVLLDENGKQFTSVQFSEHLQKKMNSGLRRLVYIIGGPYGFSQDIYDKANAKLSLSNMTFSHQMVRLFFVEQLYRGFTILRNEPYHHK